MFPRFHILINSIIKNEAKADIHFQQRKIPPRYARLDSLERSDGGGRNHTGIALAGRKPTTPGVPQACQALTAVCEVSDDT